MPLELTFAQACEFVRGEARREPKVLEAVDALLGLLLVCSPLVVGPAAAAALPTLAAKNELVKLGKLLLERIGKKKDGDHVARLSRMRAAYSLICYTSFFDALDEVLPEPARGRLKLLPSEKARLANDALFADLPVQEPAPQDPQKQPNPLACFSVSFPHPTEQFPEHAAKLAPLWKRLGDGFCAFIVKLAIWDELDEKQRQSIQSALDKIADRATRQYEAQYFELCQQFPDFAVWGNLHEHATTRTRLGELSTYVQSFAALAADSAKSIDVGLVRLQQAVADIPEALRTARAEDLATGLRKHYAARIQDPIVDDKDDRSEPGPRLAFPSVRDAFVPQSFSVLRAAPSVRQLEESATWSRSSRRNDLGAFLVSYLTSPYSTDAPLLILGHPGSGKSLLTTVLAAQLMSKQFTVIRVPLREVGADAPIVSQIQEVIKRITNVSVDSWAKLSATFRNNPPVVILDGYDELLQASGKVFAGYLTDVQSFQRNEAEQGRPVRVIVTSRVTLIDKATIPEGATIARLLEFDDAQRARWIATWNRSNAGYFHEAHIEPLALPKPDHPGAHRILALAEQPLLLLMLALYDSQDNQLRRSQLLDRTRLYDSLLRRFVERELRKQGRAYTEQTPAEKRRAIDREMQRLAVAALGMYNRRQVHILAVDLNDDLKFFKLERSVQVSAGRPMSQAELLLGSFFFVHKSEARDGSGEGSANESAAFEFLHNTFGEFLTADFIVRRTLSAVLELKAFTESDDLVNRLEKLLNSADGFPREWLSSLVYTPMFGRPVVMEMAREWVGQVLTERSLAVADFARHLERIVTNQLTRLLSKREMPSIIHKEMAEEGFRAPFGDHPLVGHVAIYSLNLVLLRVLLVSEPFRFVEKDIGTYEDGARPWDRLTHLWRSWFSTENLKGLTAVLEARRTEGVVTAQAKAKFQMADGGDRLETIVSVSSAIGDDVVAGLGGLALVARSPGGATQLSDVERRLQSEELDARIELGILRAQWWSAEVTHGDAAAFAEFVGSLLRMLAERERPSHEYEAVTSAFRAGVLRGWRSEGPQDASAVLGPVIGPSRLLFRLLERSPIAALTLVRTAREIGGMEVWERFEPEFVERLMHEPRALGDLERGGPAAALALGEVLAEIYGPLGRRWRGRPRGPRLFHRMFDPPYFMELADRSPEIAVAWLRVLRNLGGTDRIGRDVDPELLPRLIQPEVVARIFDRSPPAAISWLETLADFPGLRAAARHMGPEFSQRVVDPGFLRYLSRRDAEAGLLWMLVVGDLCGTRALWEAVSLEDVEPVLNSDAVMDAWGRAPDTVVRWVQLMASGPLGDATLDRLGPRFAERALDARFLLDLAERRPGAAASWLRAALRWTEGRDEATSVLAHAAEGWADPSFLLALSERSPAAAAACVRIVLRLDRGQGRRSLDLLESLADPQFLLNLSRQSPSTLVELVGAIAEFTTDGPRPRALARGRLGGRLLSRPLLEELLRRSPDALAPLVVAVVGRSDGRSLERSLAPDVADLVGRPAFLLEMARSAPSVALSLVRRFRLGGLAEPGEAWCAEAMPVLERWIEARSHVADPAEVAVALRVARAASYPYPGRVVHGVRLSSPEAVRGLVADLPTSALSDLRWALDAVDDVSVRSGLEEAIRGVVSG